MSDQLEYAVTQRMGSRGLAERAERPSPVLEMATRLMKWAAEPETCGSCVKETVIAVIGGEPLCDRCYAERESRLDQSGLELRRIISTRADDVDDLGGMQLRGRSIVFNSVSQDLGGFTEVIRPQAIKRTFQEKIDLRYLWAHDSSLTLGRLSAGTMRASVSTRGLDIEVDPPRWASSYVETVKRTDVRSQSFGFQTITDEWRMVDEIPRRNVLDMRVMEVSGVSWPAYQATTLRAVKGDQRSDWAKQEEVDAKLRMLAV